jgi:hypothetical protein
MVSAHRVVATSSNVALSKAYPFADTTGDRDIVLPGGLIYFPHCDACCDFEGTAHVTGIALVICNEFDILQNMSSHARCTCSMRLAEEVAAVVLNYQTEISIPRHIEGGLHMCGCRDVHNIRRVRAKLARGVGTEPGKTRPSLAKRPHV